MDKTLYSLAVPADSQALTESQLSRNLSKQGVLGSDVATVESVSLSPGQHVLRGHYRGRYADVMAREFEELFDSSGIEAVPFYQTPQSQGQGDVQDGYYSLENTTLSRVDPREDRIQKFDGILTKVGSRRSHWRAVETSPTTVTNDFASGSTATIGIPERARKVRWFDTVGGAVEDATVQESVPGELQNVDRYTTAEPSFSDPTLIYDLPYRHEGDADVRVWDDYQRSRFEPPTNDTVGSSQVGTATVGGEGIPRWQAVFRSDHDYNGTAIIENGILRLTFDESGGQLSSERWSDAIGDFATVHLGASDWQLFDLDITHIGVERVGAQVEFKRASGDYFNLNITLQRGARRALWTVPENESGPTPSGLQTKLAPVAAESDRDPSESQTVLRRKEVRR